MADESRQFDLEMMRRAIALAMRGRGCVEPNPMVGCVIVSAGRIIGEGYHARYGGQHAERAALAACAESPAGATAYVTLEPCCHTNKQTPPCVPALIHAKIARVVVGCVDPNPDVNGKGLEQLRAAGIEVALNVLEDPCKQLLAPFIARTVYDRPYVTLKWAETADGKIAGAGGKRLAISNDQSTRAVHALRGRCDAVMVGVDTVIADDPLLTARDVPFSRRLLRVVLDSRLRIPLSSKLCRTARENRVFVYFDSRLLDAEREKIQALHQVGVEPFIADRDPRGLNLEQVLIGLGGFGVSHVLVEPGPRLATSFLARPESIDRLWVIHSPLRVDDAAAPPAVNVPPEYLKTGEITMGSDRLVEYLNPYSPVFFQAAPSADFELASQ
jgi:diaminohydroxyphosphoribosylaminopyrimidine deaminase/5-amino-6-(5-phosphoribosylamino)uracil reductase